MRFGLTAAACTATPSGNAVADDSNSAIREMMVAGFNDIDSVYIDDKDLGDLTVAGLNQLSIVDPTVALNRNGAEFSLVVDGTVKAVFEAPDNTEATDWGIMAANYVDVAIGSSPTLRELDEEQLYETLFQGIIAGRIFNHSRVLDLLNNPLQHYLPYCRIANLSSPENQIYLGLVPVSDEPFDVVYFHQKVVLFGPGSEFNLLYVRDALAMLLFCLVRLLVLLILELAVVHNATNGR